ncbi:MAG: Hsp20/alpha crystallin family protein [Nitrospirae bacterium]|nr:Hsp20/alpha crystallin family protein [Nitrospirota bacterium]
MAIRDMMRLGGKEVPVRREEAHPFVSLQREMNRLFDEFWRGFPLVPTGWPESWQGGFSPRTDVAETDTQVRVTVELPGMDEKDIEVTLSGDTLTIKGEKKTEMAETREGAYHGERYYGAFRRMIPLPAEVEAGKVAASFRKGVLTITMPKAKAAEGEVRRIEVKAA